MSSNHETLSRPLRVAIIGAGPSGFYAAGSLTQQKDIDVSVDIFDRLPAPYGLVRYGVAPDHQKIKSVVRVYEKIARDPRVRYFGNIEMGRDIPHAELSEYYDAMIYAVGAQTDKRLGIPGEDLEGSLSATAFVAWYNGHPEFADIDINLDVEAVAVIGVGNVAIDVARILSRSIEELEQTDITDYALEKLRNSKVKDIYVLARRGPAQAKFTNPEIKEMGELSLTDVIIDPDHLILDPSSLTDIESDNVAARNVEIMREIAARGTAGKQRRLHFRFLCSPAEILEKDGRVAGIRVEKNRLVPTEGGGAQCRGIGEFETLPVGLVLRSVGYHGEPLEGVPFDPRNGIIPNREGRVLDPATGAALPGEYVVGWAKRGPTGVIGTNKPDAAETVRHLLEDIPELPRIDSAKADPAAIVSLLESRGVRYITFEDWIKIDQLEVERGKSLQRPRVKFVSIEDLLQQLESV